MPPASATALRQALSTVLLASLVLGACGPTRPAPEVDAPGATASPPHSRSSAVPASALTPTPTSPPAMAMAMDPGMPDAVGLHALLAGATMERATLVAVVLARNPDIAAANAGYRAALARQPQRAAWEDPVLSYRFSPLSIGSTTVAFGQEVELSQRIPLGGKTSLQSSIAVEQAAAAHADLQAVRLRLAGMAALIFEDYALALDALAITERHLAVVRELERSAQAQVATGGTSTQDALQAEAEATDLEQQRIAFTADRDVAIAQLNGLLHRPPTAALPLPSPEGGEMTPLASDSSGLQKEALAERPELQRLHAQEIGALSAVVLAQRQSLPDITVSGIYSSMWNSHDYEYGLGISVALPVNRGRLQAGIEEAEQQQIQARLEREHMTVDIQVEVESARCRLVAAQQTFVLLRDHLVPPSQERLAAARAGLAAGRDSFATVLAAERALRLVDLRVAQARTEVLHDRTLLQQAVGRLPATPSPRGAP